MVGATTGCTAARWYKLTFWSDATTGAPDVSGGDFITIEERNKALAECGEYFVRLWHERANGPPGNDLISMLVHSEKTKDMINDPMTYLGNILLLIIGGNDTTRNSLTGGVDRWRARARGARNIPRTLPALYCALRW